MGGVCGGLARRLGVSSRVVRVLAVLSGLFFAVGVVAYVAIWVGTVRQGEDTSIIARTVSDRREKEILFVVSIAAISLLVALQTFGVRVLGVVSWFLTLAALGLLVVWRGSSPEERIHLREVASAAPFVGAAPGEDRKGFAVRTGAAVILIIIGSALLNSVHGSPSAAADAIFGAGALVLALFVLFAPWWVRTVRDLSKERRDRVRAEERATMAAHVHDSVLQTLSLIRRAAGNPAEVNRLARIQERDLRLWLVDPESFGKPANPPATLAESAREIEREVEDTYDIAVEVVVVGDCPLSPPVLELLAAGREACVNAAKWSGAPSVSLYLEVERDRISMFVRDLGKGFDPSGVPTDRQGIAGSIVDRMHRCHGRAEVRSAPGSGTEVALVLPIGPGAK
jgi:signal transduction histidine kinase